MAWRQASRSTPVANGKNQTGVLRDRNKLVGRDKSQTGMLPAQKSFEAVNLPAGIEERLVHQVELIVLQRGLECGLAGCELARLLTEVGTEELQGRLPLLLGEVQSGVCVLDKQLRGGGVVGVDTDADVRCDGDCFSIRQEGFVQCVEELAADGVGVGGIVEVGDDDDELVSPQTPERVGLA